MTAKPPAAPGDWIEVDLDETSVEALLCSAPSKAAIPSVEAIYMDEDTHVRLALLKWDAGRWALAHPKANAAYVDNYPRVASFVDKLRQGRA
jgi:hypothetical protein